MFPSTVEHPAPWTISTPRCHTNLTGCDRDTNRHEILAELNRILHNYIDFNIVYTDASKSEAGVGAAVVTATESYSIKFSPHTSIFTAELYAIFHALKVTTSFPNPKTLILTDSLSSIQSLKHLYPKHPILQSIKSLLHNIQNDKKSVDFIWIPAHIGIRGNEKADLCARNAIVNVNAELITKCVVSDVKTLIREKVHNHWQQDWQRSQDKLREFKSTVTLWKHPKISRRAQVTITRLRIGHCKFTHTYLFNNDNAPICDSCQEHLTVKHVLINCTKFDTREAVTIRRLRINHTKLTHGYLMSSESRPVCRTCQVPVTVKHILTDCREYSTAYQHIKI
ncbi:uncharacterized protein LOC130895758 [Diorhabda carinulata]|uniref:uncharacterized protein LOC130895758 n=1 Tax=Diorhabda carinulata TaxID=1163345 RepID=UPI0025A2BA20|nr:uncharacterized protein LOC130895758 [Diorhabda carinulata]